MVGGKLTKRAYTYTQRIVQLEVYMMRYVVQNWASESIYEWVFVNAKIKLFNIELFMLLQLSLLLLHTLLHCWFCFELYMRLYLTYNGGCLGQDTYTMTFYVLKVCAVCTFMRARVEIEINFKTWSFYWILFYYFPSYLCNHIKVPSFFHFIFYFFFVFAEKVKSKIIINFWILYLESRILDMHFDNLEQFLFLFVKKNLFFKHSSCNKWMLYFDLGNLAFDAFKCYTKFKKNGRNAIEEEKLNILWKKIKFFLHFWHILLFIKI